MIPDVTECADLVEASCPGLYNDLAALRDVAHAAVVAAVGAAPCGQDLQKAVVLDPVAVGPGNHVLVIPGPISVQRRQGKASPMLQLTRLKVSAVVAVIFEGYPLVEMEGEHAYIPEAGTYDRASKFVLSVGWCVFCAMRDAVAAGNLLSNVDPDQDIDVTQGTFEDSGGGQATISFQVSWLAP